MNITEIALKNRLSTWVLTVSIVLLGFISYIRLPREASPDIAIPFVMVQTFYTGVSPEDMEGLITNKIEKELQGIENVKEVRSASMEGLSSITVEFEPNVIKEDALQKVRDAVDRAKPELPDDAEEPQIIELNFATFPIMLINLRGNLPPDQLKKLGDDLADGIEAIPGVLEVEVAGGREKEIQIFVDPKKLALYRLSFKDMVDTIRDEHLNLPAGDVNLGNTNYILRVPGELQLAQSFGEIVLKTQGGKALKLKDVAKIQMGYEDLRSLSRFNGKTSLTLAVKKRTGENIIQIAQKVKAFLAEQSKAFPPGVSTTITQDQSDIVFQMVRDLENNILSGLVLVVLVLFVAMGFRNALIVGLSIPLSMLLSFLVIELSGMTLNFVVLFSLILALGMLVDNAIVIVENIYRHREEGEKPFMASLIGTREVQIAVFVSTLTTLAAFFPMVFWPGIMGAFMKYLPITVIITLSSSLFVAFIINPTLASLSMKKVTPKSTQDSRFLHFYRKHLAWGMDHPKTVILGFMGFLFGTLVIYVMLSHGIEFMPEVEPNFFQVIVDAPSGTTLKQTDKIVRAIEKEALKISDAMGVTANVGAGAQSDYFSTASQGVDQGKITVDLKKKRYRKENSFHLIQQIRSFTRTLPGAAFRVEEQQHGPPTGPPINVEISGDRYEILGELSAKVKEILAVIPGVEDIRDDYEKGRPEITISINRDRAGLLGLKVRTIASAIRTAIHGYTAGEFRVGTEEYDVVVRWPKKAREDLQTLKDMVIFHEGKAIPIANLGEIKRTTGLVSIKHKDQKRMVTISAEVSGRSHYAALVEAQKRIRQKLTLPPGYSLTYTGENEEQQKAQDFLSRAFIYALVLILLILVTKFNSLKTPLIIFTSVIMSMIGVMWGLLITGLPFGILMTGIGIISLAGVVVNNAIVLLDYANQLIARGLPIKDAIITASSRRVRPVLLTAITTILGLIPLSTGISFDFHTFTWDIGGEGSQWWGPMGVAVIFGLAFATFLTLILVPLLHYRSMKKCSASDGMEQMDGS